MVKWIALFLISGAAVGVFLAYPSINEGANSACHALEKKVITTLAAHSPKHGNDARGDILGGSVVSAFSQGELASIYIKQRYPNVPPMVGCATMYWRLMFNPAEIKDVKLRL
jgi:hypothetical protein